MDEGYNLPPRTATTGPGAALRAALRGFTCFTVTGKLQKADHPQWNFPCSPVEFTQALLERFFYHKV